MTAVTITPNFLTRKRGYALVSYLQGPSESVYKHNVLSGHTNRWESREIVKIFVSMGYVTDIIDWDDTDFVPAREYNVIFDIANLFSRWKNILSQNTIKILHLTGSNPRYQNEAEKKAASEFKQRTGVFYRLKRQIDNPDSILESLELSNFATLLGSTHTLHTYPHNLQKKISLISVTASHLEFIKRHDYVPNEKNFLWYFGSGAVHKGLDKVLEVFLKRKELTLHIIGNIADDQSFWQAYRSKIADSNNIIYHGFLQPDDKVLKSIIEKVFCFIAPSCSESMSTSVATCLCLGLYPIISVDTGISLPKGLGICLDKISITGIDMAITNILSYSNDKISNDIKIIQKDAISKYSRKEFNTNMRNYLKAHLL